MKLKSFQVTKFRNIVDSGLIDLDEQVTCFVGKNEAGKSCMIEALYLFNPAYGEKFDLEDQYPRWWTGQPSVDSQSPLSAKRLSNSTGDTPPAEPCRRIGL